MNEKKEPFLGENENPFLGDSKNLFPEEKKPPNYLAWVAAAAAGAIISHVAIRQYEIYQAKQMLYQMAQEAQKQLAGFTARSAQIQQEALAAAETRRAQAEDQKQMQIRLVRERRVGDSIGLRLSRQCNEWTQLAEGIKKSEFAFQEKAKYCGQLTAYVEHGTPPRP